MKHEETKDIEEVKMNELASRAELITKTLLGMLVEFGLKMDFNDDEFVFYSDEFAATVDKDLMEDWYQLERKKKYNFS